jgi:hypothetical protein
MILTAPPLRRRPIQSPHIHVDFRRHRPATPDPAEQALSIAQGLPLPDPITCKPWSEWEVSWRRRILSWRGGGRRWQWSWMMLGPRWQREDAPTALACALNERFAAAARTGQYDEVFSGEGDFSGVAVYRFGRCIVQWSSEGVQRIIKHSPEAAQHIFRLLREQDRMSVVLQETGPLSGTAEEARDRVQMIRESSVFLDALDHDEICPDHFSD